MPDELQGVLPLSEAIAALREELLEAWRGGQGDRLLFRPSPIELTLNVGVTRAKAGQAGVKWYLFSLGGKASRESAMTQTIKVTLAPVLVDNEGNVTEFLISDLEESTGSQAQVERSLMDDDG